MTNGVIDNWYEHKPASGGKPKQMVILLHGLGSNGQDLVSLAPYWAGSVPDAIFISPDAPYAWDMGPPGYSGAFQWFSLQEWTAEARLRGGKAASPILQKFMKEQLEKYNIPASKLVLAGFSQGTMMSLYAGPRYSEKIAGILGYSGALVWEENVDVAALHKIPVRLIHGEADDVVPVSAYVNARAALEKHGFEVSGFTVPGLPHSIDPGGIESGGEFLKQVLG